jgi:hypothetical protein
MQNPATAVSALAELSWQPQGIHATLLGDSGTQNTAKAILCVQEGMHIYPS